MASKFMAFESVATTSTASMENYGDAENERIEMNTTQYPNYQSNGNNGMANDPNPYGAVDADDDFSENIEEKCEDNVGYRKFIYNNSEQLKSICGGLLLLMGSGVHIVWGIFRVFYLYNCNEDNSFYLRSVIWSWYVGAIIGSCCAGYAVVKFRKGHLYFVGGTLLIISGIFLMLAENNTNIYLLISRIIGGFTQGLIYVVVIVHASDNATKEFREFLMLIVGAVLNYSILLSVLAFFHTEGLFRTSLLNGLGLIAFGMSTIIITTKHATETVPFILQNNGSELDALQTVGKLKKKPVSARSVHHDFLVMKNLVQDEMEHYGKPNFRKVLLPENRKSLIFCCYGRLCSVLSFNLPLIVMIMLFLRHWADGTFESHGITAQKHCFAEHIPLKVDKNQNDEIEIKAPLERIVAKRHAEDFETNIEKPKSIEHDAENEKEKEKERAKEKNVKSKHTKGQNGAEESEENGKHTETTHKNEEKNHKEKTKNRMNGKEKENEEEKKEQKTKDKEKEGEKDDENKHDEQEGKKEVKEKEEKADEKNELDENKPKHHANAEKLHEKLHDKSSKQQKFKSKQSTEMETVEFKTDEKEKLSNEREHNKKPQKTDKVHLKHNDEENRSNANANDKGHEEESNGKKPGEFDKNDNHEKHELNVKEVAAPTFFAHLIIFLHSRELTLVLLAWFIFGTITAAVLYTFNLKRFIYYISCVLSSVLALTGLAHSFHLMSGILHFCLIVYFNYVTISIDVFGHCMLAEAFPVTLKPFSVASVAIIEHLVHIIIITLYLSDWFHNSILLFMCIVAFISHEIARNLPQKGNLSLSEAREQYQNIDLMLFNEPKTGYNQQQEFI